MIGEADKVEVDEKVVLQKYEGEPLPENEFERITIHNGEIVAHETIENGEPTGPVQENNLTGTNVGSLMTTAKEVD